MIRPEQEFSIVVCQESDTPVVRLRGEIDSTNAPALADALHALAAIGAREVDVDLELVTFIDSTGIRALLEGRRVGLDLRVVASSEPVDRVLQMACLESVLASGVGGKA